MAFPGELFALLSCVPIYDNIKAMKKVYLSQAAVPELVEYLEDAGWTPVSVNKIPGVAEGISHHPDIVMCDLSSEIFPGDLRKPSHDYPRDIIYNAACTGEYFIHNLKYTDPELKQRAETLGMKMIHVSQGYAKCSTLIVDRRSVIVSDRGLAKTLAASGLDVLVISAGHIRLPGYEYGFIGGASGNSGQEVIFNGDLSAHPDFEKISRFITARGMTIKYFTGYPLTDIGSVIFDRRNTE